MRKTTLLKLGIASILFLGVSWLFLSTVRSTLAEPYSMNIESLNNWTLSINELKQPIPALISLVPPSSLVPDLFQQVFARTMESLTTPTKSVMPIVLKNEFVSSLREVFSPMEILEFARMAGLDDARLVPVCMAVKRERVGGRNRQLYYVVFDSPEFAHFRSKLASLYRDSGGVSSFDPAKLDLVLQIASSDSDFAGWWPMSIDRTVDCLATFN